MVKELNALALAARGGFADVEHVGPLIQEQAQIERTWVQHQPGVAAEMLIGKAADLLMYRVFVAANALDFAYRFERAEDLTHFTVQAPGVVAHARGGQFGFADAHHGGDVAGVFARVLFF
ncbi:hypothetical protein D3C72_1767310 [compost metagenome]